MMMVLAILVAVATPASAQYGYPAQTVYDSGYTYILYSSGNIVREGSWGRRELIDDGTGTRMIAAGGGRCYALKNNGNIWMFDGSWRMIDNGTGTSEIWVDWGTVHCRKNNGQVWRCVNPYTMQWQQTNGGWRNMVRAQNFEKLEAE
jgi:hypothetical protein